jgi:ferric-dicitrate binding protein FerR (iron transport regulator)
MSTKKDNSQNQFEEKSQQFFNQADIPYTKNKDEVWAELSLRLQEPAVTKTAKISTERIVFALAASLIILLSIGSFFRFYTKTIRVEAGQQLSYRLPDGSMVDLNAQSVLRYNPLWWNISRDLSFEGEAFFQVEKGNAFIVNSIKGSTMVLGTSFNIYSRPNAYKVNCISGKVQVANKLNEKVVLTPEYEASIAANGSIIVKKNSRSDQVISWKEGMFTFTAVPLQYVIYEIERQYGVQIKYALDEDYIYTGFFSREYPVENVLDLVGKPFNLKYTKKKDNTYELSK